MFLHLSQPIKLSVTCTSKIKSYEELSLLIRFHFSKTSKTLRHDGLIKTWGMQYSNRPIQTVGSTDSHKAFTITIKFRALACSSSPNDTVPPPRRWTQYRHWLAPPFQFASDVDISKIIMYKIIWKTYKHTCNAHTMTMIPSEIPVEFCYSLDFRTWIWYPWKHVKYTLLKNSWRKIITIRLCIRAFIVILGNCALIKSSRVYGSCVKHTSSDHSPIQKPSRLINHA